MFTLRPKPFLFRGDHTYPASSPDCPVVILYAEIGTEDFYRFHKLLVRKAEAGEITYVLRHYIAVSIYAQGIVGKSNCPGEAKRKSDLS